MELTKGSSRRLRSGSPRPVLPYSVLAAHIESRKANRFEKAEKWDDAIASHEKAKELLRQAENLTEDKNVLESLFLQRESHTRQVALLEHRKELSQFINKYRANVSPSGPAIQYVIDDVDIGELRLHDIPSTQDIGASSGSDDDDIMKTIVKCDSLLYILNKRGRSSGNSDPPDLQPQRIPLGTKVPKDDRQIMEELKTQNGELRYHILGLLQEADNQQSEILSLQSKNAELQGKMYMMEHQQNNIKSESETAFKNKSESVTGLSVCDNVREEEEEEEEAGYFLTGDDMDLGSLDLPPLEIPEFKFSNEADK